MPFNSSTCNLFVDGHKSHLTPGVSDFCKENQIILVPLPPNTTHILQRADVSVFKPLKDGWKEAVKQWKFDNHPNELTNKDLHQLYFLYSKERLRKKPLLMGLKLQDFSHLM